MEPGKPHRQSGFTLVEVMVALGLLSAVLMFGGAFMIRAMFSSSQQAGRQAAVNVANQVMEQARAVDPTFDQDGVSPLVYGRDRNDVVAQWTAAADAGLAGIDAGQTYTGGGTTAYDASAYDVRSHPLGLPLHGSFPVGARTFTSSLLIGTCLQDDASGTCGRGTTGNLLFRVVVLVTWSGGNDGCPAAGCSYSATTLIDPTVDPTFNVSRRPAARPDSATTRSGAAVDIPVLLNDSGVFPLSGAVSITTAPAHGTAAPYDTNNIVQYTPAAGFTGTDTFVYKVIDSSNRVSDAGLVTIVVTP